MEYIKIKKGFCFKDTEPEAHAPLARLGRSIYFDLPSTGSTDSPQVKSGHAGGFVPAPVLKPLCGTKDGVFNLVFLVQQKKTDKPLCR